MSLLMHMIESGLFNGKKILAIDRVEKNVNDRTWCFWEQKPGLFEPVVSHNWDHLIFRDQSGSITGMNIRPYSYKMIRGIDFYRSCLSRIQAQGNIEIRYGNVTAVTGGGDSGAVTLDGRIICADWVFSSILPAAEPQAGRFRLLQHFLGWEIETSEPVFDPAAATLMDFRVSQEPGTAFVYVMPFSDTRALVEYTVFSPALLKDEDYLSALQDYCSRYLTSKPYRVRDSEFGVIPMSNETGPQDDKRLTYIGTAGGRTKPSSGYTFSFIQQQSAQLVKDISATGYPQPTVQPARYHFFDSVLLNVLATGKMNGEAVFSQLFRKNRPQNILAFLGNDSNWKQDLKILSSLPLWPFARAGWTEAWKRLH